MSAIPREVKEGRQTQGIDESIYWQITTTPWGSSPTSVTVVAKDASDSFTVVTSTVLSGSATVSGDVITLPKLYNLTQNHLYRIEVKFTCGTNVFECYFEVAAER